MLQDALEMIWSCSNGTSPEWEYRELLREIGREGLAKLCRLGLLTPVRSALFIECEPCNGAHVEKVHMKITPSGNRQYFLLCPRHGIVALAKEELRLWTFDYRPLLELVARTLRTKGGIRNLISGNCWHLGRAALAGQSRPLLVARTLFDPKEQGKPLVATEGELAVILSISDLPHAGQVPCDARRIFEMRTLVEVEGEKLIFQIEPLARQLERVVAEKSIGRKRRSSPSRVIVIDRLKKELHAHILSMKSLIHDAEFRGKEVRLPRLTQKELARRVGATESSVCRAMQQEDAVLRVLKETVRDPEMIRRYRRKLG